uniref:Cysteine rich protein 2 n=1 Tax=Ficedula albicollis TaxID=59894 RepID=A0A803VDH2_FICAL
MVPSVPQELQGVLGMAHPSLVSPAAEKVSSLGKDWHKFCLKCERCNKTLTPGGHAEHDGKPFCHKPCYATLFGPKGRSVSPLPLGLCWAAAGATSPHPTVASATSQKPG